MNTVEPIRDINTVWDIADYLGEESERNKIMFLFGRLSLIGNPALYSARIWYPYL